MNEKVVMLFLPVMKELELMGHNPIPYFTEKIIDDIGMVETKYVAISRAKEKYPEWYKVVSGFVAAQMTGVQ